MGSQALPGRRFGRRRTRPVDAPSGEQERSVWKWFGSFLREELRPYPGRVSIVARMVVAATVTMVLVMTFRIPGAAIAGYYTLLLARESPSATLRAALVVMVAYLAAGVYCLIGIWLFVDFPLPHLLWVVFSLFLCFFLIKTMTSAVASAAFAFTVTIVLPLWDAPLRQGALLTGTLWAVGSVSVGLVVTVLVEYLASTFTNSDELQTGLTDRLSTVSSWMRAESTDDSERDAARRQIAQRAMVGVSRLREMARATSDASLRVRSSTAVSLVGRLIDIAAAYPARAEQVSQSERERLHALADQVDALRIQLLTGTPAAAVHLHRGELAGRDPLVVDLEHTTHLLALSLLEPGGQAAELEPSSRVATRYFLADTFTNPEHLYYALRGCLAATLCYLIINAVAWRGLGTALATCVITALSSVGSSRQKQVLRLGGAIVGGVLFGIGSQVLILPALDTIGGFVLLFAAVTAIAAWFGTSSPRLSYFGLQIALAFYLIHLQEFYPQMNLAIGRDRVLGVLLGLVMMWLVYERLGSAPAITVMRQLFGTNLELLARLAQPWNDRRAPSAAEVRRLRDRISANFAAVNAQADAVLFETGPNRPAHLRLREHLLALQPELRSFFLVLGGLLQYRLEVDPATLAEPVRQAQESFDAALAASLQRLSTLLGPGGPGAPTPSTRDELSAAQQRVEQAIAVWGAQVRIRAAGILALNTSLVAMLGELEQRAEAFAAQPSRPEPEAGRSAAPYSESPG